jgi:hypothetical protein
MIVVLRADGATVRDADDCGRLHLETGLDDEAVRAALTTTGTGRLADDGTAWLDLGVLRGRAEAAATAPDWTERWTAMVAYAERKGWLSADGRAVQVHLERPAAG